MSIQITGGSASAPGASETVAGVVELATTTEAATGTDTVRAVTPAGLALRKIGAGWALESGGNARGAGAVDLQVTRGDPAQVASGDYAVIGGGYSNTASGNHAMVGGGYGNVASGHFAMVLGGDSARADKHGQRAHSSGIFNNAGDAQTSVLVARRITTNATPAPLFLNGADIKLMIADDTTWAFTVVVVARRTDANNESAAYRFEGCVDRNAGTTALVGTVTKTVVAEDSAGWDCNVTADDTNDALVITATGEAGKTIQWVARVELVEVTV